MTQIKTTKIRPGLYSFEFKGTKYELEDMYRHTGRREWMVHEIVWEEDGPDGFKEREWANSFDTKAQAIRVFEAALNSDIPCYHEA